MNIKAWAAAAAVMAVAAGLQWVSGLPFTRCPEEAVFAMFTLAFAGLAATFPGLYE
jgi:ABC-type branched-subunit amino acid transport system permease subunit